VVVPEDLERRSLASKLLNYSPPNPSRNRKKKKRAGPGLFECEVVEDSDLIRNLV